MDTRRLKKWKTRQVEDAHTLAQAIKPSSPADLRKFYPQFTFEECYTSSLDPYTKVWELLPYFSKVIVGITPYLKTEEEFIDWYGVSPRELLALHEKERVLIRILFPGATNTTPGYLNVFFEEGFPSTALDLAFDEAIAGPDAFQDAHERYRGLVKGSKTASSIDTFPDHIRRAFDTGKNAYCQLRVLGFSQEADTYEDILGHDVGQAQSWLEMCRLFLIGPIHYSLGGIHCVSSAADCLQPSRTAHVLQFPADLGRVLANTAGLYPRTFRARDVSLEDCLDYYPEYEEARGVLLALDEALWNGDTDRERQNLQELLDEAKTKRDALVWKLRLLASTTLGGATAFLDPTIGLLTALGFEIAARKTNLDQRFESVTRTIERLRGHEHLTLLLDLDKNVRRHFGDLRP